MKDALPLDATDIQNEDALGELLWTIEASADEFSLILARCNYGSLRSRISRLLQEQCQVPLRTVTLEQSSKTLYTTIQTALENHRDTSKPGALLVLGLESVSDLDRLLLATNQVREEFRKHFPFPLVLWVTDRVQRQLIRLAPDFESWATAIQFEIAPTDLVSALEFQTDRLFSGILDPTTNRGGTRSRSRQQAALLESLYDKDSKAPPHSTIFKRGQFQQIAVPTFQISAESTQDSEIDVALKDIQRSGIELTPVLEGGVQFALGRKAYRNQQFEQAREHYEKSLAAWQQIDNLDRQGCLHFYLGLWWRNWADLNPTEAKHACEQAQGHLQQCLDIFRQMDRLDLVAKFINALAEVLQTLEQWDRLLQVATEAQTLHQEYPDSLRLARSYGFLAEVALHQQRWQEAGQYAQSALDIVTRVPEHQRQNRRLRNFYLLVTNISTEEQQEQTLYLWLIARAQWKQGQLDAAIRSLERARENQVKVNPPLYLRVLSLLQTLYFEQGQYLKAFQTKQKQRIFEQQYGFRAFVGAARLQPQQQEEATQENLTRVPKAVAVGRQQDLNRLIERIGSTQHKLTILYGQSGVGKSSLVEAGLVPCLKSQAIGTRDVCPIYVRVYSDWAGEIAKVLTGILAGPQSRRTALGQSAPGKTTNLEFLLEQLKQNEGRNLLTVLVFDQFEDFFFVSKSAEAREQFFQFFSSCLKIPYVKVVLSLREDYLHLLLQGCRQTSLDAINDNILDKDILYYIGNFLPEEAKAIIDGLTESSQNKLEPMLVNQLVKDLAAETGEVRPIELQVVGSQLQTEGISTLQGYRDRGPKTKLVQRYLESVIADCGPGNQQMAELVLYLLTDEQNSRNLKTRAELERDLEAMPSNLALDTADLDLVLEIFVEAGLLFLLPESPANRYQLVHDYLVRLIRQKQEAKLSTLTEALEQETQSRKRSETKLNQLLKRSLAGSIVAGILLAILAAFSVHSAFMARQKRQQAEFLQAEAEALAIHSQSKTSEALFNSNRIFGALIEATRAGIHSQTVSWAPKTRQRILESPFVRLHFSHMMAALQQAVFWVQERNRLDGHEGFVWHVSFSADGQLIASASDDYTVRIWKRDGSLVAILPHSDRVSTVSFSPDSQTLVSAGDDGILKLWQQDGTLIRTFPAHDAPINAASFSPDGETLVSASDDSTLKLWTLNGQLKATLNRHWAAVRDVQYSPDGQLIASASDDRTVRLWNAEGQFIKTLEGHNSRVYSVSFSPDGQWLASGSWDYTVRLWKRGGTAVRTIEAHDDLVYDVAFSADSKQIASASRNKEIRLWRLDGTLVNSFIGHSSQVRSLDFSADGQLLASGSGDRTIRLWQPERELLTVLQGHSVHPVYDVEFAPEGDIFASASADKTVKLWQADGTPLRTLVGHDSAVWTLTFSPDGQRIASGSSDRTVKLWNRDGQLLKDLSDHGGPVYAVAFSPDGKLLASGSADRYIRLWTSAGQLIETFEAHEDGILSLHFSPDSQFLASASWDKTAKLWKTDGTLVETFESHKGWVQDVRFSPDGKYLATASADNTARLWSLKGKEIATFGGEQTVTYQDDEGLGIGNDRHLIGDAGGHLDGVTTVRFSPKNDFLATASNDNTVKFWKLDGTFITTLRGHDAGIRRLSFDPTGQQLATASEDRRVLLWNLELVGNLEALLTYSCNWLENYFETNAQLGERQQQLCDRISQSSSSS